MTNEQDWKETLDDLDRRRERSRAMGGPERLAKHHGKGKLDARARLDHLLDKGSFREFGTLVGGDIAADGIVAGSGLINGSPVMVGAEDFTTLAGSIGPGGNAKRYRLAELALRDRIPLVMLLEGAGFRPSGEHYGRTPTDLLAQAQCSGKVPMVGGPARPVGRPRRAGGAGVRLDHHEQAGRDLHRRSAGRERVHGRRDFEGRPRRPVGRAGQRGDPQPRPRTTRRCSTTSAGTCRTSRRARGRIPRRCPQTKRASRARRPNCWTSCRAATVASTTCAPCSTWSSTTGAGSRCSRSSGRR